MGLKIDMMILKMAVDQMHVFVPIFMVSDGILFGIFISWRRCSRAGLYSR